MRKGQLFVNARVHQATTTQSCTKQKRWYVAKSFSQCFWGELGSADAWLSRRLAPAASAAMWPRWMVGCFESCFHATDDAALLEAEEDFPYAPHGVMLGFTPSPSSRHSSTDKRLATPPVFNDQKLATPVLHEEDENVPPQQGRWSKIFTPSPLLQQVGSAAAFWSPLSSESGSTPGSTTFASPGFSSPGGMLGAAGSIFGRGQQ